MKLSDELEALRLHQFTNDQSPVSYRGFQIRKLFAEIERLTQENDTLKNDVLILEDKVDTLNYEITRNEYEISDLNKQLDHEKYYRD